MVENGKARCMHELGCGSTGLELWGGHECTVNRVGDRYLDQTVRTGHEHRLSDLALFADLGFSALCYPVLWERIAPDRPDERNWAWTDERLGEIRRLGMRPIAGLVHHGSGPRYTHLLDQGFATGLADHARAVAERYPWIEAWTPVNEPLTTARFSALYGHWYPHARDEGAFYGALLNQIDGVRLAGLDESLVIEVRGAELGWTAPRPARSALASERGRLMPTLEDAISRYVHLAGVARVPPAVAPRRKATKAIEERRSFAAAAEARTAG